MSVLGYTKCVPTAFAFQPARRPLRTMVFGWPMRRPALVVHGSGHRHPVLRPLPWTRLRNFDLSLDGPRGHGHAPRPMASLAQSPAPFTDTELLACIKVLEIIASDRAALSHVEREARLWLLIAAARVSEPDRGAQRRLAKALGSGTQAAFCPVAVVDRTCHPRSWSNARIGS
jgi:hypothetical protein